MAASLEHPSFHTLEGEEAARVLEVDPRNGLSAEEAARRRESVGPNRIAEARRVPAWRRLLAQFTDLFVLLLLGAAALSVALGEAADVVAILAIVVLNAVLGFVHERRAERALDALRDLAPPRARARRGGDTEVLDAADLVPGDVVLLEAGDLVPADLRLVESAELRAQESALTGESMPVDKTTEPSSDASLPVADRAGMAWKGTLCVHGSGVGIVTATGMRTELGRVATLLREERGVDTPLQRRLAKFARKMALAVGVLCVLVLAWGLARGEPPALMILTAVSLAVAAIPEALPAMSTLTLSLGARRMAEQKALVRHLPAVEALGGVTWICTDKTGTLTENRMRVEAFHCDGETTDAPPPEETRSEAWRALLDACALNADVQRDPEGGLLGDPTEIALVEAAEEHGVDRKSAEERAPRVAALAFSSERGRMTTVHESDGRRTAFVKGAPEAILDRCTSALGAGDGSQEGALDAAEELAARGLRVLAFATREAPASARGDSNGGGYSEEELEQDLAFVGFAGLWDPPREGASEAVRECRAAGIRVAMVTGDHSSTAAAIARELGIAEEGEEPVTGRQLAAEDGAPSPERIAAASVFSRVAPEHKVALVRALQESGESVAMTGDGVNDAPALRRADIGIAMGRGGTDVAREAAAIVLLDDNFATIVAAVREGRRIDGNLRKFLKYVLTGNAGEIVAVALAPAFGLPLPLLPLQILWVNLVTDGLPGLALSLEPAEEDVMRRPPRPPGEGLVTRSIGLHVALVGLLAGGVCLAGQAAAGDAEPERARTMAFTVLTLAQLGHVVAIRADRAPLWSRSGASSRALAVTVGATLLLQLATLYVPALASILGTVPLDGGELALAAGLAALVPAAVEVEKALRRRKRTVSAGSPRSTRPSPPRPTEGSP